MTVRAMLNALFAVGSVVLLSGDVLSPCPGPGLAWSLGQMVFTIQWQPQRLTQEDQILDMEDQSEANTAVTSGSENLAALSTDPASVTQCNEQ